MNNTIVLVLTGPIARDTLPMLCKRVRALLETNDADLVVCDVGAIAEPDAVTIDALARLQITARRLGREVQILEPSADLAGLLELTGLSETVPRCPELFLESRRQGEQREPAIGVEEERDPADPIP